MFELVYAFLAFLSPVCVIRFKPENFDTFWKPGRVSFLIKLFDAEKLSENDDDLPATAYVNVYNEDGFLALDFDMQCEQV